MTCRDVIYWAGHFDVYTYLMHAPKLKPKTGGSKQRKRPRQYFNQLCAFDIETSVLPFVKDRSGAVNPHAFMWVWQFQIDDYCTIMGRTWDEYKAVCSEIDRACTERDLYLVVWVHNLSYEFQFLSGVFPVEQDDVFAVKSRKVLRCDIGRIEYRDSYLQTNMSLDAFTHKMGVAHVKLTGTLDYRKIRYPWTPIADSELAYCVNDVRGLVEAIDAELQLDGDDLYTIPMTSTGYVRRDVKKSMWPIVDRMVQPLLSDAVLYLLLRSAFWGGDTHANRYYTGRKLEHVKSADKASAYPAAQCTNLFPVTPFVNEEPSVARLKYDLRCRRACVMRIALYGLRQKYSWWGFPYISFSKCDTCANPVLDNGRVLSADYAVLACTDIDFDIICKEYEFTGMRVFQLYSAKYGRLPDKLTDVVKKYYYAKTELKGVKGQELYYTKSKNKLNSVYGMTAQKPIHGEVIYDGVTFHETAVDESELDEELQKAYKGAFLPYQWAVWTTAHVRRSLKDLQWACGRQGVYCDTDCVKYVGTVDFRSINKELKRKARAAKAWATDPKGVTHYMGVFEQEDEYAEFMTWGAKKYATSYRKGGKITTTIAGVNKRIGGLELQLWGGFDAFKPGFVFHLAGGADLVYNDAPDVEPLEIDGHRLEISKNVANMDGDYTLGITAEYAKLLGYRMECAE